MGVDVSDFIIDVACRQCVRNDKNVANVDNIHYALSLQLPLCQLPKYVNLNIINVFELNLEYLNWQIFEY